MTFIHVVANFLTKLQSLNTNSRYFHCFNHWSISLTALVVINRKNLQKTAFLVPHNKVFGLNLQEVISGWSLHVLLGFSPGIPASLHSLKTHRLRYIGGWAHLNCPEVWIWVWMVVLLHRGPCDGQSAGIGSRTQTALILMNVHLSPFLSFSRFKPLVCLWPLSIIVPIWFC